MTGSMMMAENKIYEVAFNKDKILEKLEGKPAKCPVCGEAYFSVFDKLFIASYGRCVADVKNDNELERMSNNIFEIL